MRTQNHPAAAYFVDSINIEIAPYHRHAAVACPLGRAIDIGFATISPLARKSSVSAWGQKRI
jgi:hypothetical protein